jgi:hypothetical protein
VKGKNMNPFPPIVIESDVPVPAARREPGPILIAMRSMLVSQSFSLPVPAGRKPSVVQCQIVCIAKRNKLRVVTRTERRPDGSAQVRTWRIE